MVRLRRHRFPRQAPSVESVSGFPINTSKFARYGVRAVSSNCSGVYFVSPGSHLHAGEAPNLEDNDCGAVRA